MEDRAAGGGKSYAQLIDAFLYACKYKGSKQLILRRTFPELSRSLILTSLTLYPQTICKYNQASHKWIFKWGSTIEFGYCDTEKDVTKYQSAEYDVIRFDELTHFTEFQYTYLISRIRGVNNFPKMVKSSTNPGSVGHAWVKERFIEPCPSETVYTDGTGRTRIFIPAKVQENKFLMAYDPDYIRRLEQLPEKERKALLDGDWNIFEGQAFSEFRNDPTHYDDMKWTHVIREFDVPKTWPRYRSFDFGYTKPFSVAWWTIDYNGTIYRYRELYGCVPDKPNVGIRLHPKEIAIKIKEIETQLEKGNRIYGVADPSIFDESRGESIARQMEREGIYFSPGDNTRLAGKMQLHYRLAFDVEGYPGLYITDNCKGFIRTIPKIIIDDKNVEDIDTDGEDHVYDETRYLLMEHPIAPRAKPIIEYKTKIDPLSEHKFNFNEFMKM